MSDLSPTPAPEDYWSSDGQLHPTVGPDMSGIESVEAASTETTRAVLEAIGSPKQVPQPGDDEIDPTQVLRADGQTGELPMMAIPGFGEEYDDCGKPMPMACSGCGHTTEVGRTCRRSTCPRCGAAWVRDRAKNLCGQLGATRAVRDKNRDDHQRYHHLAWMPPEDWRLQSKDVLERTRETIRDMMYALDLEGYVFYHPWSGSGYDDDESGDDRGKWKDRLFSDREWEGDVREELEFRPHFHIVCVGHKVPGQDFSKEIYDRTGWILTRICKSEENAVSIYDDEDLAKVVTYCLSHSAIDLDAGSDGSAQRTYRRYGPVITDPKVSPDDNALEHHDRLVRQAATTTLGIPMKDQFCFAETFGNTGMDDYTKVRAAITAQAAGDSSDGSSDMGDGPGSDEGNDATASPDATAAVEMDGELTTPAKKAEENPSLDLEDASECEGQMVHLCDARHLLDDDDWMEDAEYSHELQSTLDEWADKMDELIRWGPFNSG